MVDITNIPKRERQIALWTVSFGIVAFWTLITTGFEVNLSGQSTEVYSSLPLVRYMSAVGIIAVHYPIWKIARSGYVTTPVDPRTGLIILIWILVILHSLFTALGPVNVAPYELPVTPYKYIGWITAPAIFFAGVVLNEKENQN